MRSTTPAVPTACVEGLSGAEPCCSAFDQGVVTIGDDRSRFTGVQDSSPLAGGATHCAEVAGGSQRLPSLTVIGEWVDATVRSCGGGQTESLSGQDLDPGESCWFSGNNATSVVEIWQHRGCAELVSAYKCRFVHWKHARNRLLSTVPRQKRT